jgi:hypothetical protein
MLFPLWWSSLLLKGICFESISRCCFYSRCIPLFIVCAVRKSIDVVLLTVLLGMLHWLVGLSMLLD